MGSNSVTVAPITLTPEQFPFNYGAWRVAYGVQWFRHPTPDVPTTVQGTMAFVIRDVDLRCGTSRYLRCLPRIPLAHPGTVRLLNALTIGPPPGVRRTDRVTPQGLMTLSCRPFAGLSTSNLSWHGSLEEVERTRSPS